MKPNVVLLDYGSGNLHSAVKALERAGAQVRLTADRSAALAADGLVVPGVGAFAAVKSQLDEVLGGAIIDTRLAGDLPVLGICVGMQVLFASGNERGVECAGLGQWPGKVTELQSQTLPHIGWNTVMSEPDSKLFRGLENERFYFVHSYAVQNWELDVLPKYRSVQLTWAEYGSRFLAAVENGPLSATQFHPEKSADAGIQLLKNWLDTIR